MLIFWKFIAILAFGVACTYAYTDSFSFPSILAILTTFGGIIAIEYKEGQSPKKKESGNLDQNTPFVAKYGSKTNSVDVTGLLKNKILHGFLSVKACNSELSAGRDPAFGEEKELFVEFSKPTIREIRVPEGTRLEIK